MCIHNVESSAHAAKNRAEAQSNSMEITAPVTDKEEPGAQSSDTKNQFPDLSKSQNNMDQIHNVPSSLSNERKSSQDLSNPTSESKDQIPQSNNLPSEANAEFSIPNKKNLRDINGMLGGDWRTLALLISTENNKTMIGIPDKEEAKNKVKIHFKDAIEKQRKNLAVPFDVTLEDLVIRIQHLLSANIHWRCLANCLVEEDFIKMISAVYEALPDFNTFWAAFSMPHYNKRHEVKDRYQQNIIPAGNDERILVDELNALREGVELEDKNENLPHNVRETRKFSHFLSKENLLKYATSSEDKLYEKFKQLSTMEVDKSKWREYLNRFGISQFKTQKTGKHFCTTYTLQNPDFIGEKVIAKNNCVGSLGWPLENTNGAKCQLTSSHVVLNEKRFLCLGEKEHLNRMIKLEHTYVCRYGKILGKECDLECSCFSKDIPGTVSSGCYKSGGNMSSGLEIAVIITENLYKVIYKDLPEAGFIYYQWKTFDFPDTLYFNGLVQHPDKVDENMPVYKFGKVTGLTKGQITNKECYFKFHHPFSQNKDNPSVVKLKNQYKVAWEECLFSEEGDSGGIVFTVNKESGEITAIGLLTGNNKKKEVSFVTPLHQVCEVFRKEYRLRNFVIKLRKK